MQLSKHFLISSFLNVKTVKLKYLKLKKLCLFLIVVNKFQVERE